MKTHFHLLLFFFVCLHFGVHAENAKQGVSVWKIDPHSGDKEFIEVDTIALNYHSKTNPVYNHTIATSWLGNLGLPAESKIYFDKNQGYVTHSFLFKNTYASYFLSPENSSFYNTKTPFSNVSYHTGGFTYREEDNISGLFTVNATPKLNFSLLANHIYGRGAYQNQATDGLSGALYGSYLGDKYGIHFITALNNLKHFENGGIADISQLTSTIESYNLPVNLSNAWSIFHSFYLYASQQYHLGFHTNDNKFVPVTTFGHSISFEQNQKKYYEKSISDFYQNSYYSTTSTNDTVAFNVLKNTAYISLNEGFHKWALMGVRAFIDFDIEQNTDLTADWSLRKKTTSLVYAGGDISKTKGNTTYHALGKMMLLGDARGEYELNGKLNTQLKLGSQNIQLQGKARLVSSNPYHHLEHYYSNHFMWERDYENIVRTQCSGSISLPNKVANITLKAGVENTTNYIYFDTNALPQQYSNAIQIVHGEATLNLHLGNIHFENTAIFQQSSNEAILPLPSLSSYHNLYVTHTLFNVLKFQIGADCRYHTAYYANAYMPATGQFYRQTETLIGNYPFINLYANFHLKRTRFFVMYYNLSEAIFTDKNYTLVPNYPLNPGMVKFGLSWNFYD